MTMEKKTPSKKVWLAVIAIVLIVLLFIWLTVADMLGDTDVAALISPVTAAAAPPCFRRPGGAHLPSPSGSLTPFPNIC